jgi:hypothetical protein
MLNCSPSRLTRSCVAALLGVSAWSTSPQAFAQSEAAPAATPPPNQKPPCVPAASYTLGYDCELFPLPSLAGAAPAPAAAAGVAVAVVPVPVPGGVPIPATPAGGAPDVAVPAAGSPDAVVPVPAAPAEPAVAAATTTPSAPSTPTDSSSSSGPSHAPAYVAFAVGVGGVGMTVAFGILALSTKSTLNGECSGNVCPSSASSDVSTLKTDGILADVGLGVAVAGVALGAILFATEHGPATTSGGLHVNPWIGLGAGGLKGSF